MCSVVLRGEVGLGPTYTALSYCWGKKAIQEKLSLITTNFGRLRAGLPLYSLPKTNRDAISVTAQLGIGYIWIDALCIYQDSQDDWRTEAAMMQDVYKNSYLTISAVAGSDDHSGLFL